MKKLCIIFREKVVFLLLLLPFLGFGQIIPAGTYLIGVSQKAPYNTLVNAIARVNSSGISGPVTFLIDENQTVTSPITINQFVGSSAVNTLTIKPNIGRNVTVSGDINDGSILAFNNAANIIIDGNNLSADNMLTIYNKNNFGYGKRAAIQFYNDSSNNKIQNLKVNLEIAGITTGILSVGIFAGGQSLGTKGNNPNNTIKNVTFTNVKQALMVVGENQNNKDWNILNNTIKSTDDNTKAFLGIYILNAYNYTISGNTVSGIKLPAGVGSSPFHSGVYLENANNSFVSRNIISNIQNSAGNAVGYGIFIKGDYNQVNDNSVKGLDSNSTNDGSYGIKSEGNNTTIYRNDIANVFSSEAKNTNGIYVSGNNQLVYNNFVNDVKAAGGGDPSNQSGFGIYINDGSGVKLYYNTVVLKTNQKVGVSAALFIKAGSKLDIRNNIFINNQTASTRFAIYSEVTNSSNFDYLDYNDYFSTQHIGSFGSYYTNTNIKTSLADWKAATGKDKKSINILPAFVSPTDLHLQTGTANNALKAGAAISGITTDIDGDARDTKQPYIGADEICSLPTAAGAIIGTSTVCKGQAGVQYSVPVISNAISYMWSYSGTGVTITNETTNNPTITFATSATSGNLTVYGMNACGKGESSASFVIDVNYLPSTPTIIKGAATVCQGQAGVAYSVPVITNATSYVWTYSGTGATITNETTNNPTITFSESATPGNLTVYGLNGCGKGESSAKFAVAVNPLPVTPTVVTVTQPTCVIPSGSVVLGNLPATGWMINIKGSMTKVVEGSGNSYTISGLAAGTYNFTLSNGGCSSLATADVVIKPLITNVWNGTAWSDQGNLPTLDQPVVFNGDFKSTEDMNACSCTVNSGKVIINTGHALTVANQIDVLAAGSLTIESDANLIQNNDKAVNTGKITVKRNAMMKRLDYTYWSAPVSDQSLKDFSPSTVSTRFLEYHENDDYFYAVNWLSNFEPGKGYAVRAPNNFTTEVKSFEGKFVGKPNNGEVTFALKYQSGKGVKEGELTGNGYNLIGNPYPSNIDFTQLVRDNSDLLEGTAYFWTNLNPNPAMEGSGYPGKGFFNNYAMLNRAGSVPATYGLAKNVEGKFPSEIIEVGQGFIVKAKKSGGLVFKNSYRTPESDRVFFNKGAARTERDRYWLQLTTPLDVVNTALIAYVDQATNGYEAGYDAEVLSLGSDALFTTLADRKLGIQARQFPLQTSDIVALGMSHYEAGNYTLSIAKAEGIFNSGQSIYVKDKQTGIVTNLSRDNYTFSANGGLSQGRFEIIYQPDVVLVTDNKVKEGVVVYRDGSDFIITSKNEKMTGIEIYDTSGKLISKLQPNSTKVLIPAERMSNGLYVLKINQNETVTVKKILK
ncbi:T9SS type A sorting domain-containing protein [Chryseobacterium sp. MDT2-18]|uniref:T9SS type A sorting domain-containing protein n=1 Tax=Chryseobacterium sp. MDT2-18 TaxID=1259136 RepID=UPI002782C605|nr:T9SS type A sorting domain-containing protein [Chryseobacterium sp. MDT2-18]MDQ0476862.1 hypothetical protein [Chryseobacterium sp. MDT2-18]